MKIFTKRFILRDFIKEDEPAFFAYRADPRYAEFCTPEELTPNHTRQLLKLFHNWASEHPRRNYQLAIIDRRKAQELIGCCGLRQEGYDCDNRAEIGIELAPQFWGRYAYAIEIAKALIDFGFHDLGLQEIRGISVSANLRVARLAERSGFVAITTSSSEGGWDQTEWQLTRQFWETSIR